MSARDLPRDAAEEIFLQRTSNFFLLSKLKLKLKLKLKN